MVTYSLLSGTFFHICTKLLSTYSMSQLKRGIANARNAHHALSKEYVSKYVFYGIDVS